MLLLLLVWPCARMLLLVWPCVPCARMRRYHGEMLRDDAERILVALQVACSPPQCASCLLVCVLVCRPSSPRPLLA